MRTSFSLLLAALCLPPFNLTSAERPTKKLIEFGWDEPDTAFLREHIATMEATPFDGCVFHVDYRRADGGKGSFTWEAWGTSAFSLSDVQSAVTDLQATAFRRFRHNFLRFNTTPARLDWFEDHSAVLQNAELAARIAKLGKCPGLLFDIEQYDGKLFTYPKQRHASTKTWNDYAAQVRLRGQETMQAFQRGYPGLTVFLTFGYSLPWVASHRSKEKLALPDYGLLAPFLDGMLEAAEGNTRLIDGHELSYGFKEAAQFTQAHRMMQQELLPIVANPEKYRQHFSFGFGLWLDQNWRKLGWNTNAFGSNYFSPESFQRSVTQALSTTDEYVWIYSESPRWWSKDGRPANLPVEYQEALRRAREGARQP